VCVACVAATTVQPGPHTCPVCSRPVQKGVACGNPICNWDDRSFGRIYSVCLKSAPIEKMIWRYKYDGLTGWGVIMGRLVLGWLDEHIDPDSYDMIVANPTHASRPVRHTEGILEAAAREDLDAHWPYAPAALIKTDDTPQSAKGTWKQKWEAALELRSVIQRADGVSFTGKRVLLFDDITTTCAQMQVVGRMLRNWGASHVDGLVVARAV
jgi:predicted amidophosphoribosyltransferase